MRSLLFSLLLLLFSTASFAQWAMPASGWVAVPGSKGSVYGVYYFRKTVNLASLPQRCVVRVSADNRYKLLVNGTQVSAGPARSDLAHWNYERVDLRPLMHEGENTVAAVVWNDGDMAPEANLSYRTAFMVQGEDAAGKRFDTDSSWLCIEDKGYKPLAVVVPGYYAAGPGELVDKRVSVNNWASANADVKDWQHAQVVAAVQYLGTNEGWGTYPGWMLRQSDLPQRELMTQRLQAVRQSNVKMSLGFLSGKEALSIPAHSSASLILDQQELTNAYMNLLFSKGRDAQLSIGYAEALYDKGMKKGNRDDLSGKHFVGRKDSIISNGSTDQLFTTLAWRTYRYVVLNIKTADEPLLINDIYGQRTGYPFDLKASLGKAPKEMQQMFDIGWRTARLCAIETYMDCPYYEQLQYFGDARIQALVTMFMTGDDRLVKNFYNLADWSRGCEGVTQSRYPSRLAQWIQPYALHYIYSLHDYMMYGSDLNFIKDKLQGVRDILNYFGHYLTADGRVKDLPGWNFTDWVDNRDNWQRGIALPGTDGCNAVMDMQLLYAYQMASDLERQLGMAAYADLYGQQARQLAQTIKKHYWRDGKGLFSDLSDKDVFSQHANALAILCGLVSGDGVLNLARKIENDTTLAPASIYFKYYTHQAMAQAGLGDDYMNWLGKWREYMVNGLTTWGETSDVSGTRSDCHAWGASPNVEFFRTVLGINSDAPGFKKVRIAPHLGNLKEISGTMPHPQGSITVSYQRKGNRLTADIILPANTDGTFSWLGKSHTLHAGFNHLSNE